MGKLSWTSVVLVVASLTAGCVVYALGGHEVAYALLGSALGLVVPAPMPWPMGKSIQDNTKLPPTP